MSRDDLHRWENEGGLVPLGMRVGFMVEAHVPDNHSVSAIQNMLVMAIESYGNASVILQYLVPDNGDEEEVS